MPARYVQWPLSVRLSVCLSVCMHVTSLRYVQQRTIASGRALLLDAKDIGEIQIGLHQRGRHTQVG